MNNWTTGKKIFGKRYVVRYQEHFRDRVGIWLGYPSLLRYLISEKMESLAQFDYSSEGKRNVNWELARSVSAQLTSVKTLARKLYNRGDEHLSRVKGIIRGGKGSSSFPKTMCKMKTYLSSKINDALALEISVSEGD